MGASQLWSCVLRGMEASQLLGWDGGESASGAVKGGWGRVSFGVVFCGEWRRVSFRESALELGGVVVGFFSGGRGPSQLPGL